MTLFGGGVFKSGFFASNYFAGTPVAPSPTPGGGSGFVQPIVVRLKDLFKSPSIDECLSISEAIACPVLFNKDDFLCYSYSTCTFLPVISTRCIPVSSESRCISSPGDVFSRAYPSSPMVMDRTNELLEAERDMVIARDESEALLIAVNDIL